MTRNSLVMLEVEVLNLTAAAIKIKHEGVPVWLPLSQIDLDETDVKLEIGAKGELAIPEWLATEKGLT